MHDLRKEIKLKWWPSLQDYNEAIQIPQSSLQDSELKTGLPYTGALGLPRPVTGSFASVYRMHCSHKDYALRLFLRNIEDQAKRYALISDFVQHDNLPYTVTFDFLANGIKSHGEWFPALKMEWVEGTPFEEYVIENLKDSNKLGRLLNNFLRMMEEMRTAGIAHGDLQHGNIIICKDEIRLVDYDGMFVPAMKNLSAAELGHPNYQHPARSEAHFGPYLDNFSAWVIYASIKALQIDPGLLDQLGGCDDCLLFRRTDFIDPLQSAAFAAFEKHKNEELQSLGRFIRAQLAQDVTKIPHLQLPLPDKSQSMLIPIADTVSSIKIGPRIIRSDSAEWLKQDDLGTLPGYEYNSPQTYAYTTINGTKSIDLSQPSQPSWIVGHQTPQPALWVKPTQNNSTSKKAGRVTSVSKKQLQLIPPDLLKRGSKRVLVFDKKAGLQTIVNQCWMLLNPIVWAMIVYFSNANTIDENLKLNATQYDAHVTSVHRYVTYSKNSTDHHTDVNAQFTVDGKQFNANKIDMGEDNDRFKVGQIYPIRALASNPTIQEPLFAGAGTQQSRDRTASICLFLVNLLIEFLIWRKAFSHRKLAKKGIGVQVTVEDIVAPNSKVDALNSKLVFLKYNIYGTVYFDVSLMSFAQCASLKKGSTESALYNPEDPAHVTLYKFCMFKPAFPPVGTFQSPPQPIKKP